MTSCERGSTALARAIRRSAVEMVTAAKASHLGGSLSCADILAVLYASILRIEPQSLMLPSRDRLIFSKGHCCSALYAVLAHCGFLDVEELATYGRDGSRLMSHASACVPGVEFSSGSLGHGLPYAAGLALAAKRKKLGFRVFVICSDGELDEGSNWESFLFAPHHGLDNLTVIIDYNKIQSLGAVKTVLDLEPVAAKLHAFNWSVKEVDGHCHSSLSAALGSLPWHDGKPSVLIAHTVKGKGVSFMEDDLAWHYRSPSKEQFVNALDEIG